MLVLEVVYLLKSAPVTLTLLAYYGPEASFLAPKLYLRFFELAALYCGDTFFVKFFDTLLRLVYWREIGH